MRFGKLRLDHCRHGWMLHAGPYIGKCFELYGEYSEAEVDVLRLFLRDGSTAIDVGANIGDLTLPMSRLVGASGRVFAFESHSGTFQTLNANMALNGVANVKTINAFVAQSADASMSGPWGDFGFVSEKWRPDVMAIDALRLETCNFIKVDVDGAELDVLQSADATIRAHQPVLYVENDAREKSPALLEHLLGLDYAVYFHAAPIFRAENFFDNPVNHWPQEIVSLMVLAMPKPLAETIKLELPRVTDPGHWWPFLPQ